jgi:sugar phosphate isomerase/epimerase
MVFPDLSQIERPVIRRATGWIKKGRITMNNPRFTLGVMVREVKKATFEDTLERIHDMRFECVQFNLNVLGLPTVPASLPPGKAGEIGASFWAYGLTLAAVSGTFNTAHPDEAIRKAGAAGIRTLCEAAADMGTQVITLSTGTLNPDNMWRSHPDNNSPEAWKTMLQTLKEITKTAEEHSVILAFETEVSNIVNTVDKAVRVMEEVGSDNLKVVMDPANLLFPEDIGRQQEIFEDAFNRLGSNIVLAHAKDVGEYDESTGELKRVAAGKGRLDYPGYLKLLKESGYQGAIIIHSLAEEEMPASREFLSNLLIKA